MARSPKAVSAATPLKAERSAKLPKSPSGAISRNAAPTVSLVAHNRIWLTYQHFPYKTWTAVSELVDNSTGSYFDNRKLLNKQLKRENEHFAVRIHLDNSLFSIVDNAMGMDLVDLARAVQLAAPPEDTSGRSEFGMGMKTSCCWLGREWSIITTKLGSPVEYTVTINVEEIAHSDSHEIPVQEKAAGGDEHYTRIEVRDLYPRFRTRALPKTKDYLVQTYRNDVESGDVQIWWEGKELKLPSIKPLETDLDGVKRTWKKDIDFEVEGRTVTGWVSILGDGERGRSKAGFDLYRRGRVIIGRPLGYRPVRVFGEARNDRLNQRIYGQVHLDAFPVNHLKDDFLWDGLEEKFEDKLIATCKDYFEFAKDFKVRGEKENKVGDATVTAANEEIVAELSDEEMEQRLAIVELMEVPDDPDPAVTEAKAARLRAQKIEPVMMTVGTLKFRIYHPKGMSDTERYFFRQSAQSQEIDIFINDNHPFVAAIADEASYLMFVRMCVFDAIVEHQLLHRDGGGGQATFPARMKDTLLRGVKL